MVPSNFTFPNKVSDPYDTFMRKVLLNLLVLLMLTPSLVCAMPMCAGKSGKTATASVPCAGHHGEHDTKPAREKLRFVQDCMGVDLTSADNAPVLKAPDLARVAALIIPAASFLAAQAIPVDKHHIRGPPPDWPEPHQTQPSVLLITQRLLI